MHEKCPGDYSYQGLPPLGEFLARSDSAALSFDQFRTDHARSSWLTVLGGKANEHLQGLSTKVPGRTMNFARM